MLTQPAEQGSGAAQNPNVIARRGLTLPGRELKFSEFHNRLRAALVEPRLNIYIDTSLLMWLLKISATARREFLDWCDATDRAGRVFVTTWCAHELYRHLREESVLNQIRERVGNQRKMLEDVVRFVDQSYDDSLCADTDFANKAAAIEGLRNSVGIVNKNLGQFLQKSLKPAYSNAEAEVREFVNTHSVWTDATNIVASVKPEFLHRVEGRIPPGYEDQAKEENSFGDFIFWREVLARADSNPVLILTNDCKTDWVHVVSKIENYQGKPLGRTPQTGFDAQLPHPFLAFEAGERGILQLEVINVGNLALFLEMEQPQSAKYLVAAAYPRGLDESPIPNWDIVGIRRPPETAVTDLASITLHSLKLNVPSQQLKQALRLLLRGEREDVLSFVSPTAFPELLPTISGIEAAALGKAFFRAIAVYPGSHSLAEVLQTAGQTHASSQSALYLGMLLGIYLSNSNEVRRTPGGDLAQGVFALATESYATSAFERLDTILEAENVWLLAKPTAALGSVAVVFEFQNDIDPLQTLASISVASNEVFDQTAADQRKLLKFFPGGHCTVDELLRVIAREFTIPLGALSTEYEGSKSVTWEKSAGLGILRTDLRKVATDLEVLFEDPSHE
ncbi:MAG: hypothetical protein JWM43_3486 [Acidobacteriaceae bacterium]|nr:hypothetical protein [Acidobacteriaceae bacterium]